MVLLCFVYMSYAQTKRQQTGNFMSAFLGIMEEFGISGLDVAVMMCLPVVNYISNGIYFTSFKTNCTGINRMSKLLANVNEEIHIYSEKRFSGRTCRKWIGNELFLILWVITASCVGVYVLCWSTMFNDSENVSKVDKILFCLVQILLGASYIYPAVAYSADMLVTTLVYDTKDAFDKLKILMEYWNTTKKVAGFNQRKLALFEKAKTER